MNYITPSEVLSLTTNDRIKGMAVDSDNLKIFIAGAEAIADSYRYDTSRPGFSSVIKLGVILIIDFIAFSNIGGGAFKSESVGSQINYSINDNGMKRKLAEFETILGPYIVNGSGGKRIRMSQMVRVDRY
jgi:hypothetical protein